MSEPEPHREPRADPGGGPPRESVVGVVGVSVGLLLFGAIVLTFASSRGGPVDGAERLARLFRAAPPFGMELDDARRLPSGEVLLRLARPGADAGATQEEADPEPPPDELVVIDYPSPRPVAGLFGIGDERERDGRGAGEQDGGASEASEASAKVATWEADPSFEWHTTLRRGKIAWSAWQADYAVERAFSKGGGWRDAARVNLSQPGSPRVLFCLWPEGVAASDEVLETCLRSIRIETEGEQGAAAEAR